MTNSTTVCAVNADSIVAEAPKTVAKSPQSKERALYLEAKRKVTALEKEVKALKTQQAFPFFQMAVRMSLNMINRHLDSIVNYSGSDSPYDTGEVGDCHATSVMQLAAWRAKLALTEKFESFNGLDEVFYGISGAAECAYNSITAQDSAYGRYLKSLAASVDAFAELCDTLDSRGDSFFVDAEVQNV